MGIGVNGAHGPCVYQNVEEENENVIANVMNQGRCLEVRSVLENTLKRTPVGQAFVNMVCNMRFQLHFLLKYYD